MNTPAQCGVIKPPKTDIYSEAPQEELVEAGKLTPEQAKALMSSVGDALPPEVRAMLPDAAG